MLAEIEVAVLANVIGVAFFFPLREQDVRVAAEVRDLRRVGDRVREVIKRACARRGLVVSARTDQPVGVDVRAAQEDVVIEPGMIHSTANMAIDIREERESPVVIADENPTTHSPGSLSGDLRRRSSAMLSSEGNAADIVPIGVDADVLVRGLVAEQRVRKREQRETGCEQRRQRNRARRRDSPAIAACVAEV